MRDIWFISDTHFTHKNIITFLDDNGVRFRPFSSAEEMDELMVENWNKTVKPQDKIYHLGDVTMRDKYLPIMNRLNGTKVLIPGNHDIFHIDLYRKYFNRIYGYKVIEKVIFSHIPVHKYSSGRFRANVHGHTHNNNVSDTRYPIGLVDDPFYINVCVEKINFTPISYEEVFLKVKQAESSENYK
jgi:calcineurin-like phosphoesterase family protein